MKTVRCPTCKARVKAPIKDNPDSAGFFPFCSQRCKLIDLGAWLDGSYRITTPVEQSGGEGAGGSETPPKG
jgi:endogenous inhibitor of DNA gyrase (YacG/DUF329 family)